MHNDARETEEKDLIEMNALTKDTFNFNLFATKHPDAVQYMLSFLDMKSAARFGLVSRICRSHYIMFAADNNFWRDKVFAELTVFPRSHDFSTFENFYKKDFKLICEIDRLANNSSAKHADWVQLFAKVIAGGFEKLIPRFSGKITNYDELCDKEDTCHNRYLHLAAINGHAHLIEFLLQQHVTVDLVDGGYIACSDSPYGVWCSGAGLTPLCYAAMSGSCKGLQLLLDAGAWVNFGSSSHGGATPLHFAARHRYLDCFKLLIDKGADPNISTIDGFFGETALAVARKNDTPEWQAYLREKFPPDQGCSIS